MTQASADKTRSRSTARSASRPTPNAVASTRAGPSPLVQFAAARANDLADALHEVARDRIDRAQRSVTHIGVESLWQRAQPLLLRAATFVRDNPLRAGMIVAFLTGAALLTRTSSSAHRS